jgi:hypothetical protein
MNSSSPPFERAWTWITRIKYRTPFLVYWEMPLHPYALSQYSDRTYANSCY